MSNSFEIIQRLNKNKAILASTSATLGITAVGIVRAQHATQIVAGSTAHPSAIATATVTTASGEVVILSKIALAGIGKAIFIGGFVAVGLLVGFGLYHWLSSDSEPELVEEDKSSIEEAIDKSKLNDALNKDKS